MALSLNTSTQFQSQENETLTFELNTVVIQVYNIYLYLMIVLGASGNSLVFIVFINHPPSTTTDWFILFITTCDFITSLINVPVYATFTNGLWRYYGSDIICKLHMFVSQSLVLSSAFVISGLALDRYVKVCRPVTSFSKEKARNVCFSISLVTILLSIPCFTMFENSQGQCQPIGMETGLFVYYMLLFLAFVFSAGVVVFSYTHVTKAIRNSERKVASHHSLKRSEFGKKPACFKKMNKVMPYSASQAETNVTPKDGGYERYNVQPTDSGMKRKAQAKNIFVLTPKRDNFISGTSIRDNNPSTSNVVKGVRQETSNIRTQRLLITALNREIGLTGEMSDGRNCRKNQMTSLRTTKIAFLVCTLFIVTWIPPWTSFILSAVPGTKQNIIALNYMLFGRMTYLINNMTNPVLYMWLNRKFRKRIIEIFCCRRANI